METVSLLCSASQLRTERQAWRRQETAGDRVLHQARLQSSTALAWIRVAPVSALTYKVLRHLSPPCSCRLPCSLLCSCVDFLAVLRPDKARSSFEAQHTLCLPPGMARGVTCSVPSALDSGGLSLTTHHSGTLLTHYS